jgi:acetyltransferase-like isoleucine patch superfamily enzyme
MFHETAIIETSDIGDGTNIWAYTHISKGVVIGKDCTIGENVYIGNDVVIGDRCRIQNGALIYKGVTMGNDVFIGPGVVTTNDIYPELPVGDWSGRFKPTRIEDMASIGANATILCGIVLGEGCMVGAGSVVTRSIHNGEIVVGNPAKHLRWK